MSCETLTISGERFDFQIFKNTQTEGTDRTVGKLTQDAEAESRQVHGLRPPPLGPVRGHVRPRPEGKQSPNGAGAPRFS